MIATTKSAFIKTVGQMAEHNVPDGTELYWDGLHYDADNKCGEQGT